ncbi:MAG: hypothetical protein ACRCTC_04210 [Cetobacterium sp.]
MKIVNGGIDTIQLELVGLYKKELQDLKCILSDKTTYTANNNTRIVIKANIELSSLNSVLASIELLMNEIQCERWQIVRVDIACDSIDKLECNMTTARMFLECLSVVRRKENLKVYKTIKGIEEVGNLKISSKRTATTIYSCLDKLRLANTRIENRSHDIRSEEEARKILIKELEKYIEEIDSLHIAFEKVEEKYIEELTQLYHKTINKKYKGFTEFVSFADSQGYLLTANILKELIKKVGMQIGYKKFVENFRKTRKEVLSFTSKNDLKNLSKEMKKVLKKTVKS